MTEEKSSKCKINCKKVLKDFSKNYWGIATVVLAVLLVATLISGGVSGAVIGADAAGQKVLEFASSQGAEATLIEVNDNGQFYEVVLEMQGQQFPLYVTKDGESFTQQLIPLTTQAVTETPSQPSTPKTVIPQNIPKSDKPIVEAFVMSHCPFGTQAEKGLLPVMNLLGDKINAEFKFVYYAMHADKEVKEQLNQYCIQKEQNELYLDYLTCFLGTTSGTSEEGATCITSTGIDTAKLATCVEATDKEFNIIANLEDKSSWMNGRFPQFNIHKTENDKYSVGGSPTLAINGVKIEAQDTTGDGRADTYVFNDQSIPFGRDAETYKQIICSLFNVAPEECNEDLSSLGNPAPGFGFGTQGGATAAGCGA